MRLAELADKLGATLPDPASADLSVARVMTLEDATPDSISFIANPKYMGQLNGTRAAAVLADARTFESQRTRFPCPAVIVPNAYLAFAQAVQVLHPAPTHEPGVSGLAFVDAAAELGHGVCIMPLAYVGRARIGRGTVIYPHTFIDDDVELGEDCTVYPHVVLMRGTRVGARAILQPGCVMGSDGFGFAPSADGTPEKIPQVGVVHVGDDVEIGACTTIDRAALGVTRIGGHVKIDNHVQIAHNVQLGENVIISGHSAIAGSAKLEKNVMLGGCSAVVGHITVGEGAKLAAAAQTMHSIPAGETWSGVPAIPRGQWARMILHSQNLDEHVKTLRQLQKRVDELEARAKQG
ncbi:MAG: UDP-3-O-(3-hydroxymyristoyl)glucosamine N-acyltransferase [Deltaproteobacteria bacterium]|nr:UDP-3-O-(3-hydroxymyristoyl)glucosamine N-acyltransferase [Deltaproteobacteria bacterium]